MLSKAEEAGLVLQPENVERAHYVCCCCGDCCGILTTLKKFPRPIEFCASNHRATVDQEHCNACEACADRCQLGRPSRLSMAQPESILTAVSAAATAW
jgi:electron transport complex protein RnfB